MKKVFSASFNEVQNIISKDELVELYKNKSKKLKSRDVFMFFVFYFILMAPLYFFYFIRMGLVKGYENYPEEFTVPLDLNNSFIPFLDNFYFVHIVAILFLAIILWSIIERRTNFLKATLIYNSGLVLYGMALFLYMFKVFQIFVSNPLLRITYVVFFLITVGYALMRCYNKAIHYIYEEGSQESKPKGTVNGKRLFGVFVMLYGFFQVFKFTSAGQQYMEFEQKLIGSLLEFLPLAVAFTPLLLTLFIKPIIRYYYLNKFSEPFREKFNFEKNEWHGQL